MSPTYWTSSQIITASRSHGWDITPIPYPDGPMILRRNGVRIQVQYTAAGGVHWASWDRMYGDLWGSFTVDRRHKHKLETVLGWIDGVEPLVFS